MDQINEKTNLITLRRAEETDLKFVISAEREPENAQYVGQWTMEQHLNSLYNKDFFHMIVEDSNTCIPVGYVILAGLENLNHCIEFRRFVICDKGRGLGRETIELIKKTAFEQLNAHRLWLDVRSKNYRAQNLYKSVGFKEEGILREAVFCNGRYESLIVMSLLEKEYERDINK